MHHVPTIIEGDSLLITVVGGVVIGLGMGLALRNGGALDGIDMLAVLLSRKLPFGTSDLILFLNTFVFILVSTFLALKVPFYQRSHILLLQKLYILLKKD